MTSVAFITLGCPKNEVDTARMRARVAASSYELSNDPRQADVVVVNTCSFITSATAASIETILEIPELERETPPLLLVAGCLVNRYSEDELSGEMPEVDAFVAIEGEHDLCAVIERLTGEPSGVSDNDELAPLSDAPFAYLMIADGCDRACAYCTIPSIRGPYISKTPEALLAEAQTLINEGKRELILIAQDTTAYGHDLPDKPSLAALVRLLCEKTSVERLRLMYLQPEGFTDELLEVIATYPQVQHYLEMPLQHCEKRILRLMNRAGDAQAFEALIARIRTVVPDMVLRSTFIAGFPSETAEESTALVDFVRRVAFDYVGVFPYSPEEGTEAAVLPLQLPEETRLARTQHLRDVGDEIAWDKLERFIDAELSVLVEDYDEEEGAWVGRSYFQAPEIDGVVRFVLPEDASKELRTAYETIQSGALVTVKVQDCFLYDLEGVFCGSVN